MLIGGNGAANQRALAHLSIETAPADPADLPRLLEELVLRPGSPHRGVSLVILDSIQGAGVSGGADTVACRAAMETARRLQAARVATLLVGHVTKQNAVRGPRSLEHAVDAVLLLDRRGGRRTLAVPKNRFGPAVLRPVPLAIDPVTTRLHPAPHAAAQVVGVRAYLPGTGLAVLQVAASLPPGGGRGRLGSCRGVPRDEALHALGCLGRVAGFEQVVGELDFAVACRGMDGPVPVEGSRSKASLLHLPLCVALAGACLGREVPGELVAVGELDLAGRTYPLPPEVLAGLTPLLRAGGMRGTRVLCPAADMKYLLWNCQCPLIGARSAEEAVEGVWPDAEREALASSC
jgi:DNA repair protein RadA/Sms